MPNLLRSLFCGNKYMKINDKKLIIMKKKCFCFILVALAALSCKKDPNYSESGFPQGGSEYPYIYASVADTKASLDGSKVVWQKGDLLTVYGNPLDENYNETATYLMKDETDIAEGRFTFQKMVCGKKLTAVKSAEFISGGSDLSFQTVEPVLFPARLKGEAASDGKIVLGHTTPYGKISVKSASSKPRTLFKAAVIASGIGGEDIDTLKLGISPNVLLSEDKVSEYYFLTVSLPQSAVKCILYDTDGGYMETELGELAFSEGTVTELPLISYEPKKIVTYYPGTELEPVTVHQMVGDEEKDVLWAPVYCGYSAEHPNGLLYQYGRKAGQPYYPASSGSSIVKAGPVQDPADEYFYKGSKWYSGTALTSWPMSESEAGYVDGRIANPCPSGWRVPAIAELEGLLKIGFTQSTSWAFSDGGGSDAQKNAVEVKTGFTLKDDSGLFFAAAGGRVGGTGQAYYRGTGEGAYARIWASDRDNGDLTKASCLSLTRKGSSVEPDGFESKMRNDYTVAGGLSVRCVKGN